MGFVNQLKSDNIFDINSTTLEGNYEDGPMYKHRKIEYDD